MLRTIGVALLVICAACGAPKRGDDDGNPDGNNPGGDGNQAGCSAEAKLIYTVDQGNTL